MAMPFRSILFGALALFSAACGGTSTLQDPSPTPVADDAADQSRGTSTLPDPSRAPVADDPADQSLWPSDATELRFESVGGLVPPPPPGSECQNTSATSFTLTVSDRKLSWDSCLYQGSGGNQHLIGSRTLTSDELQSVIGAVKSVTLSTKTTCAFDKPIETLEITSPAGTKEYLDDFYACDMKGVHVSNIDAVASVLRRLAFPAD